MAIVSHKPTLTPIFSPLPLPQSSTNKTTTPNYFILSQFLPTDCDSLLKYLILKLDNTAHVHVTTSLINNYSLANKLPIRNANYQKISRPKLNYRAVRRGVIFLLDHAILLRIKPKTAHFVMNPTIAYPVSTANGRTIPVRYAKEWGEIQENGLTEDNVSAFATRYWVEMWDRKEKMAVRGKIDKRDKKLKNLYKYCKSTCLGSF